MSPGERRSVRIRAHACKRCDELAELIAVRSAALGAALISNRPPKEIAHARQFAIFALDAMALHYGAEHVTRVEACQLAPTEQP